MSATKTISLRCPNLKCQQPLRVDRQHTGRQIHCPKCNSGLFVPIPRSNDARERKQIHRIPLIWIVAIIYGALFVIAIATTLIFVASSAPFRNNRYSGEEEVVAFLEPLDDDIKPQKKRAWAELKKIQKNRDPLRSAVAKKAPEHNELVYLANLLRESKPLILQLRQAKSFEYAPIVAFHVNEKKPVTVSSMKSLIRSLSKRGCSPRWIYLQLGRIKRTNGDVNQALYLPNGRSNGTIPVRPKDSPSLYDKDVPLRVTIPVRSALYFEDEKVLKMDHTHYRSNNEFSIPDSVEAEWWQYDLIWVAMQKEGPSAGRVLAVMVNCERLMKLPDRR